MSRDKGINNRSHVYDPVLKMKINTTRFLGPEVTTKFVSVGIESQQHQSLRQTQRFDKVGILKNVKI